MADTKDESTGPRVGGGASPPRDELAPGTQLDHFVIRQKLGQGGMGVVYEADDQTIRRKVAIKVLRHDTGSLGGRLIEEAQRQGKLTHANVVTVYTASRYRDQIFIAMEFMAGGTLATWLKRGRTVAEITKMFLAAGEGLAAAHAAGLVHRDFKPENVLLDSDGEPHVGDFGLAAEGQLTARPVAGTRGFMAPEQERGGAVDHRADQYSFCVSLYSALYKEMPGETTRPLRPQSTSHLLAVPLWLRRVVVKGLSADPNERYPSMKALLFELANDPARKRRQRILTAVSAVSVAALAGGALWLSVRETAEERARRVCTERVKTSSDALWNQARRSKAEEAFRHELASGVWTQVDQHLDAEVKGWTLASLEACLLAPTDAKRAPFQACLEQRRRTLDSMGDLFSTADRGVVSNAINTVMLELQPAEACEPVPVEANAAPPTSAEDDEMRSRLAKVRVLRAAGKYVPARIEALAVKDQAEDSDAPELLAEAQLAVGELYGDQLGDGAEEYLLNAIVTAEGIGNDELRVRAWIALLGWSSERGKDDQALLARREANALVAKLGRPALLDAEWLSAVGAFDRKQGNFDGARDAFSRALDLRIAHLPAAHPLVLRTRLYWATSLPASDPRRLSEQQAVLDARVKLFGPRHAETVNAVLELARTQMERTACDTAKDLFAQAVSESLDRADENPLDAGGAYIELAMALDCLGHTDDALNQACDGLRLLRKGGASADEVERVEALMRRIEHKAPGRNASCESAAK